MSHDRYEQLIMLLWKPFGKIIEIVGISMSLEMEQTLWFTGIIPIKVAWVCLKSCILMSLRPALLIIRRNASVTALGLIGLPSGLMNTKSSVFKLTPSWILSNSWSARYTFSNSTSEGGNVTLLPFKLRAEMQTNTSWMKSSWGNPKNMTSALDCTF